MIGHIYELLSVFQEATEISCMGKDPTLSLIVPLYNYLLDQTEDVNSNTEESLAFDRAAVACKDRLTVQIMSQATLMFVMMLVMNFMYYVYCYAFV